VLRKLPLAARRHELRYPWDGKSGAVEAVEALIRQRKRSGSGIAVDSLDSFNDANAERLIAANHIVAWVVSAGV